jgi:ABC-type nitrate/sulfonate/bicarbonate transport system substrate-binding protein
MGRRRLRVAALAVALVASAAACGEDDLGIDDGARPDVPAVRAGAPFPEERCERNRAAGTITFLTSFDYAAAASIIDVVAADAQGYFDELCLDVRLQAGFSTANVPLVAAGQAQMTSLGSFSEVVMANRAEAEIVAVAVEGKTAIDALLVEDGRGVRTLADVAGRKVGSKGGIPFSIRGMLAKAGVSDDDYTPVEVGFNPVVLFETEIDALPAYKSNEPGQLDRGGYAGRYTLYDPRDDDIPGSFAVFATSRRFADRHPTAVADFLRAALRGFEWAKANPTAAVAEAISRSDPQFFFDPEGEAFRWATEADLVTATTPSGTAVGAILPDQLRAEVDLLVELGVIPRAAADIEADYDDRFVRAITDGERLVWPS